MSAWTIFIVIFVLQFEGSVLFQGRIPVGAIFDWEDEASKTGFLFAVAQFNANNNGKAFQLSAILDVIDVNDSFKLASSICSHMAQGVFMLFGARRFESNSIVQAYSQTFHVPYVSPSLSDNIPRKLPSYQLHMKPSHAKALVDLIMHFQWRSVHYVYDSEEGLFSLQDILKIFEVKKYYIQVRMRKLKDVDSAHEDLRALDNYDDTDSRVQKHIVLDLSTENAYKTVMKQIREVGMNKAGYNYILGSLDFLNLDMERYQHGGVNITGFQLVNYSSSFVKQFMHNWKKLDPAVWPGASSNSIHVDAALAVDAITVILHTLTNMVANSTNVFKHTFRRGQVYNYNRTRGVPCSTNPPVPWMLGESLMEGMKLLHFEGVSGNVEFDKYGFRKNYKMDVYNVGLNNGPNKIGRWSPDGGVYTETEYLETVNETDAEKVYIVTSIEEEPFLMKKIFKMNKDGQPALPKDKNDRYEGYCVDLAAQIAEFVDFKYEIKLVNDSIYGSPIVSKDNSTDKQEWNGMIGELLRGEAEIAIAPLSITSKREEVVDFSKPYMDIGISIMIKKPEKKKPGVFSFMQPFTLALWLCIVAGYFAVGLSIFLVSRISSAEWRRSRMNKNMTFNKFNLANSLWFSMGSLMLQGSDDTCPRSASGRIIGGVWWFVVLIMISSYTANLAAFLTIEKLLTPINGADDLVKQSDISYGTLKDGSTQSFFMDSRVSTYRNMYYYMASKKPSVWVSSTEEGINRVRESKGKYAFLMESVYNEYANNRYPCDTMKVGPNLNSNHYGIATRKYLPLRDDITFAVLKLTEDGILEKMKKSWWIDKGQCGFDTGHRESKKKSLSLSNVAGIYFILIAGLVFSIIIGVIEFIYSKSKPDGRVGGNEVEYMLPVAETTETMPDTSGLDGYHTNNYKTEHGPGSPANGNGSMTHNNHFSYDPPAYSKISFEVDANTSV